MSFDPIGGLTFLALLAVIYVPIEWAFRRRDQPLFREGFWTDMAFFWGQQLLFVGVTLLLLNETGDLLDETVAAEFRASVAAQPLWLQIIEVIVLCDVCVYWGHRLSHRIPFLWRFHRVHHTSKRLDWLAGYREHPIDGFCTMFIENIPALILGFPLALIAGFVAFRGFWAVFIHSNVRIPLGPFAMLLGSPQLHHWHHDAEVGGTVNFANLSPLMDILFGTYHNPPGVDPGRYGNDEVQDTRYLAQLVGPIKEAVDQWRPSRLGTNSTELGRTTPQNSPPNRSGPTAEPGTTPNSTSPLKAPRALERPSLDPLPTTPE